MNAEVGGAVMPMVPSKRRSPSARNGNALAVWLRILAEGGRWTVDDVTAAFPDMERSQASTLLHGLTLRGPALKRFERVKGMPGSRIKFGISEDCLLPHGVSIRALAAIGFRFTQPEGDKNDA